MKLRETTREHHRLQENFSCRLLIKVLKPQLMYWPTYIQSDMNNNHLPRKLVTQVTKGLIRSTNKALTERKKVICVEPGAQDPESSVLTPPPLFK